MLPIFNEYKKFFNDNNIDISEFEDNKLWMDKQIIKGFNKNGEIEKILRINVDENLNITHKYYAKKVKNTDLENWTETYLRLKNNIDAKEKESIDVLVELTNKYKSHSVILNTSTGKDSMLVDYICGKANINIDRKLFNNTTMDTADTYKMAKSDKKIEIITPKLSNGENRSFYTMIKKHGVPSRHHRWCCSHFKEGGSAQYLKGEDNLLFIMGMRNEESSTRSDYGFEWANEQWLNKTWVSVLPIRKWTELELWLYTIYNNIEINPKYRKGYQRCGCHIACPFYAKSTWVLDKYWYPVQYKRFHDILDKDFVDNQKWTRINCTKEEYHNNWNGGVVRNQPTEEVVQEFADYKNIDTSIAEKYFTKTCCECNNTKGNPTAINKKDEVAMNLKLLGRNTEKFMCKKCLMKFFNIDKNQWDEYIKRFKSQGCDLF